MQFVAGPQTSHGDVICSTSAFTPAQSLWDFWIKDDGKSDDEYLDNNKNNHNIRAIGCPASGCNCGEDGCSIIWGSMHGLCRNSKLRNERKGADVILSCDQGDIACEQETSPCVVELSDKQEELNEKQEELNTCTENIDNNEDGEETGESDESNGAEETGETEDSEENEDNEETEENKETDEIGETEETKDQRT